MPGLWVYVFKGERIMEITENELQAQTNNLLDAVPFITIKNDSELEEANGILRKIATLRKAAKAHFEGLKKPFNEAMANLRAKEKEFLAPMEKGEATIKRLIVDYNRKIEEQLKEEQAKLDEMAKQMEGTGISVLPSVKLEKPKMQGTSIRNRYDFEIVDPNLIPREYLLVDTAAIGRVVRALKEKTNIPGIKVKVVQDIVTRVL